MGMKALLVGLFATPEREVMEAIDRADGILRSSLEVRTISFVMDDDRELLAAIREAENDSIDAAVKCRAHKLMQEMKQ